VVLPADIVCCGARWDDNCRVPTSQSDRRLRRNGWWLLAFVAACIAVLIVFGIMATSCARSSRLNPTLPQPLRPIPVPQTSCRYLQRVHDTAVQAGQASGTTSVNTDPRTWTRQTVALGQILTAFDRALLDAAAHTPAPIATRLTTVHEQVRVGFAQLSTQRTGHDWAANTLASVVTGYAALRDASDLTGNACGITVAPDASTYLNTAS